MTEAGPDYNVIGEIDDKEVQEGLLEGISSADSKKGTIKKKNYEEVLKEQYQAVGFGFFQILLAICSGSGFFVNGMEITMVSLILGTLQKAWSLSRFETGCLASAIFLGMGVGAIAGGMIADRFGRKIIFITGICITMLFSLLSAASPNYITFLALRTTLGFGLGAQVPIDTTMLMEHMPFFGRGTLQSFLFCCWSLGNIWVCVCGWVVIPNWGWNWFVAIASVPPLFFIAFRFFIPESPKYYMSHKNSEPIDRIFNQIALLNCRKRYRSKNDEIAGQMSLKSIQFSSQDMSFWGQMGLLFHPNFMATTILLLIIWMCTAYGLFGFVILAPVISERNHSNGYLYNVLIASSMFFGYVICLFVLDFFPRKLVLFVCLLTSAFTACMIGFWSNTYWFITWALITSFFASAPFAVLYVYTTEAFPTLIRATGLGLCSFFYRIGGILTPVIGQVLLEKSYSWPFFTYAIVLLVATVCTFMLPFETKGRGLQDSLPIDNVDSSSFMDNSFNQENQEQIDDEFEIKSDATNMKRINANNDASSSEENSDFHDEQVKIMDFDSFNKK